MMTRLTGRAFRLVTAKQKPFLVVEVNNKHIATVRDADGLRTTLSALAIARGLQTQVIEEITPSWTLLRWTE